GFLTVLICDSVIRLAEPLQVLAIDLSNKWRSSHIRDQGRQWQAASRDVARPRSPRTIHFHIYVARKHRQRYESVNDVALCGGPLMPRSRSRSVGCNDRASCVRHSLQSVAAWQQPKGTGCAQGACGQVVTGAPAGGKLGGDQGCRYKNDATMAGSNPRSAKGGSRRSEERRVGKECRSR